MATTMIPPVSTSPPAAGPLRFVPVRANLLPDEIITARQTEVVRKQVLLGLVVLIALIAAWYAVSWLQTGASNRDLDAADRQGATYQSQQNQYAPLVRAQADVQSIQTELRGLMANDLSWTKTLTTLRAKAPAGVSLVTVGATVNAPTANGPAAAPAPLNQTGKAPVGLLTLSGSAPDKKAVAAYADRLATVKGLAAPLVSNVSTEASGVKFTMSVIITSDALGGRYSTPATLAPTGGH